MSVAAGIRFRCLVSQLTLQEKQSFITSLDHDLIMKALFYYAMHQLGGRSEIDPADDVSQMVSNIIQSREPEKEEIKDTPCKTLDHLPQRLIGNVASYLVESRYELFSQCNSAIYLGCNSPNLLQDLFVYSENRAIRDKITKIPRYPFAKHVHVQIDEISMKRAGALLETLCKMNCTRSLTMSMQATYQSLCAFDIIAGRVRGELFSEQIEFLDICMGQRIEMWTTPPYWFDPARFVYSLIRFRNIKYLSLTMRESRIDDEEFDQEYMDEIASTFTSLLGLSLRGMNIIGETILRTNHKLLRYLFIELWKDDDFSLMNSLTFPMIKELQLEVNDLVPIISFVDNASSTNLERISLGLWCGDFDEDLSDPDSMEIVLEKVITNYLKLKYLKVTIEFEGEDDYEWNDLGYYHTPMTASIFNGICSGLTRTKDLFRDTFKISIKTALINKKERTECIECLEKMMKTLTCCNIEDFMVILKIYGTADVKEMKEKEDSHMIPAIRLEELQSLYSVSEKIDISNVPSYRHSTFVITRQECKMNGYADRWVMSRHDMDNY